MKYLCFLALSLFTSCAKTPDPSVSVYPVREPFEYVLTASANSFNGLLVQRMNETCKAPFVIRETKNYNGFLVVYFNCKVGR